VIEMTLSDVAAATGGQLEDGALGPALVTGVEFDSRSVGAGGLFVAVAGDRVDGHDFAADALRAGAVAVLAARPVGGPAVIVGGSPVEALGRLAHAALARLPGVDVVGVTGSAGKTTTKDLLAALLARLGPTVAPAGSLNTEIGYPHTVLRCTVDTRYLVLESGARRMGDITALCRIARPRLAAVLNVGSAHLGEFGSREAIAAAKSELVQALPAAAAGGVAVLNADDPLVRAMSTTTPARIVLFGTATDADVRAADVTVGPDGRASYTLVGGGQNAPIRLGLVGEHQVSNSLAAAAIALELGLPLPAVADTITAATPASRWRMEVVERSDGVLLVNDAYNANPESMLAAVRTLAGLGAARPGRSIAVLGPMAELGAATEREHNALGRSVAALGIDRLIVVGADAGGIYDGARAAGMRGESSTHVPDIAAAADVVSADVRSGDVVLVKASRSVGLERLALDLAGRTDGGAAEVTP